MKEVTQWFLQRVTGFFLFLGLMVHFYVMHFEDPSAIEYTLITERFSNPYWITFDIFFLAILSYHSFNGLRGMAIEYIQSEKLLKTVRISIFFLSIIVFISGVSLIIK